VFALRQRLLDASR